MSMMSLSTEDDDPIINPASEEELQRHVRFQKSLLDHREKFYALAEKDFTGNRAALLSIYHAVLVDAAHYAAAYQIRVMLETIDRLGLGTLPAVYGYGVYQKGAFTLPAGEIEPTVREKLFYHVPKCAPFSMVINGLKKSPTLVPWEQQAAKLPELLPARRRDGTWDKGLLEKLASAEAAPHEMVIKHLLLKTGPWLMWFYPDPGDWLANWQKCLQFVRDYSSLDNSLRYPAHPFVFTILPLDPSKATPPLPASVSATTTPAAAPVTASTPPATSAPPPQYPLDDQPL